LDDDTEQREAGVAVHVSFPGREVQGALAYYHGHDVVIGDQILRHSPARQLQQRPLIPKAAGVMEQMAESDHPTEIGQLGDVFVHIIVKGKLSSLRQQEDGGSAELFGH
jgi:hypothetical protein